MRLSRHAVYTIVHPDTLKAAVGSRGMRTQITEKRVWKSAQDLLKAASEEGTRVPLLLADATDTSRLTHWAILESVEIKGRTTRYRISEVRALSPVRSPTELVLTRQGRRIAEGFIRPYALVTTPDFLASTNRKDAQKELARAFIERLPTRQRRPVLRALAETIRSVHARAPNGWGLTLHKGGRTARLNAGPIEAFTLLPEGVRLLVVGASARRAGGAQGIYGAVPDAAALLVDYSEFQAEWPKLRKDHFALLEKAAPPGRKYSWRRHHSESLVACIAEELSLSLPTPGYPLERDGGANRVPAPGYLMLWNGRPDTWADRATSFLEVVRTGSTELTWFSGNRKEIPVGSRVFFKRTGPGRGIVASGHTTGPVEEERKGARYKRSVPVRLDAMVNPDSDDRLPQALLDQGVLKEVNWNTQGTGMELAEEVVQTLDGLWRDHLSTLGAAIHAPQLTQARSISLVRRFARDSKFSRLVRERGKGGCAACGAGRSYAKANILEAAHIRAVEHQGPDVIANALLLCPNHHALFDQGYWTVAKKGRAIIRSKKLPSDLEDTFGTVLRVPWPLDERQLEWHSETVFLG